MATINPISLVYSCKKKFFLSKIFIRSRPYCGSGPRTGIDRTDYSDSKRFRLEGWIVDYGFIYLSECDWPILYLPCRNLPWMSRSCSARGEVIRIFFFSIEKTRMD